MKHRWMVLLLAALVALPALGHGDKKHVVGTIEKLTAESIVVKTQDGTPVEVKLAPTTHYVTSAGKPAKFTDLAVGHRVVIHADPKGADLVAATVKFSSARAAAATSLPRKPS
jgi:ABC-type Fe3+-hydroxamate transport system substrate-binding protein